MEVRSRSSLSTVSITVSHGEKGMEEIKGKNLKSGAGAWMGGRVLHRNVE